MHQDIPGRHASSKQSRRLSERETCMRRDELIITSNRPPASRPLHYAIAQRFRWIRALDIRTC